MTAHPIRTLLQSANMPVSYTHLTAGREGENTEKGTLFLCLLRKSFPHLSLQRNSQYAKKEQKKNAAISKRLQRFLKSIFNFAGHFHLSSFSTSLISFAVAVTIRIPVSYTHLDVYKRQTP